ncbi:DMT family transporter [bacterium]|nr:DMT family transporter [bacterium]
MTLSHAGEFAALATACFWTVTALSFEAAGRRVGSLALNWIRLVIGLLFLTLFRTLFKGEAVPVSAPRSAWIWLSLSGLVGFVFGDLCLFKAFTLIGSRISMLIMALAPVLTAWLGWVFLGERLTLLNMAGMALTITGIALVVLERNGGRGFKLNHPAEGVLLALGGALGQAGGLVLSKYGMGDYDAFASTQIRILAGLAGFSVLYLFMRVWPRIGAAFRNRQAMWLMTVGAFFGPFLGVSFSLIAVQNTHAGIASTIMALVPVLIIAPAVLLFREKVTFREIIGAAIAVGGVALLFM